MTRAVQAGRPRVLIVKTGYGETLDPDSDGVVSLGDILRSTVLLHAFPDAHITWLVDPKGAPLLADNRRIDCVISAERTVPDSLAAQAFDTIVNLEKHPGICAGLERVPARERFGFRYDTTRNTVEPCAHAERALDMCRDSAVKLSQEHSWSGNLYRLIGQRYRGEPYVLGGVPARRAKADIGLNHLVGAKFPLKRWPEPQWRALHDTLSATHSVSWQQGQHDLAAYIDWIAGCRLLVTNDSLGLHIAIAMQKPTIALFGPSLASEIDHWPFLTKIAVPDCARCATEACARARACMETITVDDVAAAARAALANGRAAAAA